MQTDTQTQNSETVTLQKPNPGSKFRSAKKMPPPKEKSSGITRVYAEKTHGRVNIITNSRYNTQSSSRLMSPLEAQQRNAALYGVTSNSALRKKRKPSRRLSLKKAPIVPTAPKDPVTIKKNWLINQVKQHVASLDIPLLITSLFMCFAGLIAVNSATLTYGTHRFVIVQFCACALGFCVMTLLSVADYRQLIRQYRTIIALNALMLIVTYIFGSSVTESSNANWIDLGFIKIQPSEFSKLMFIYSFSVHLSLVKDRLNKISTFITLFIHACLIFGLVLLQRDLGSLTIFLMIFVAMCFAAGLSIWYYIAGAAIAVGLSPFIWRHLGVYQQNRILLCFDSSIDPGGTGIRYQQLRSQTAIGNGGLFGTGYTHGTVTQGLSDRLPAKHTDMIFATVCEEWGLIGALVILGATCYLIYRILKIALECENPVGRYICVGVAALLITQVAENVGMCLGIMPVIGITFPFLSYGGSSALSTFLAIGMALSVRSHKEKTFFS